MIGGKVTGGESLGVAPPGRLRRAVGGDSAGGDTSVTADDLAGVDAYLASTAPPDPAVVRLRAAELARQRSRLVKPPGYDRALTQLRTHRMVLLLGGVGTGRATAALGLLAEVGERTDVVVVGDPSRAELDEYELSEGCRVVLDLPKNPDDPSSDLSNATRVLVGRIEAVAGYVVICSIPGQRAAIEGTFRRYASTIGPVPAWEVLAAHLREHGASDVLVAAVERSAAVREICTNARGPGIVARLATLLADPDRSAEDPDPADRVEQTARAFARFGNDATARFDGGVSNDSVDEADTPELARSLLLSAALAENLDVGALQIEDVLLDQLERPTRAQALGRIGTGLRLRRLGDVVHEDDGPVRFKHESHAIELLCHVWVNYPHLRTALYTWVRSIPDAMAESLDRNQDFGIAEQFVRLCDRVNSGKQALNLVAEWAVGSRESRLTAVVALNRAALSRTIGGEVRRQLHSWAVDAAAATGLHDVILRTCSGPFARSCPGVALNVLGHLAERAETTGPARAAIIELAHDEVVLLHVFKVLAEWFAIPVRRVTAVGILTELLSPTAPVVGMALCRDRVRSRLVELVCRVLDDPDPGVSRDLVALVLEYARTPVPDRRADPEAMASILVESACGSNQRSGRLVWSVADWLTDDRWNGDGAGPERRELYTLITRSVDGSGGARERVALGSERCGR